MAAVHSAVSGGRVLCVVLPQTIDIPGVQLNPLELPLAVFLHSDAIVVICLHGLRFQVSRTGSLTDDKRHAAGFHRAPFLDTAH